MQTARRLSVSKSIVFAGLVLMSSLADLPAWAGDGSSDCACEVKSSCSCSTWFVRANALIMQRSTPRSLALMQDTTNPAQQLNADDFDFDWQGGWDVQVLRQCDEGLSWDVRYFNLTGWDAATTATTNSTLLNPLRINTNPPTFAPNVQTIDARYGSDLESAELNGRLPVDCNWTGLVGFRYFGLNEDIETQLNAGPQTFFYDIRTRNHLFGIQLGAVSREFCYDAWRFDATIKAGLFADSANHNTQLNTAAAVAVADGRSDKTSAMGELAFMGAYDFTDDWALRFGYQLLWIDNVVLASDQIPVTDFNTATGIDPNGDVFYHGAVLGLEYRR